MKEGEQKCCVRSLCVADVNIDLLIEAVNTHDEVSIFLKSELEGILLGTDSDSFAQSLVDAETALSNVKICLAKALGVAPEILEERLNSLRG